MKPSISSIISPLLVVVAFLTPSTWAVRMLTTSSLQTCQANSSFSANLFQVALTPGNKTVSFNVNGESSISGNVLIELQLVAYGLNVYSTTLNPCEIGLSGLCDMHPGNVQIHSANNVIPASVLSQVPGVAYTVPDLQATVRVLFNSSKTGEPLACVEANLSNGKTVDQEAVAWVTAIIAGLGLIASAITSGLGHSNTAAHVASNALALFGYFQSQAFIGMTAVPLPPIVASWTQNFQWSMGIIRVGFLETLATWYQRSTGGTAAQLLEELAVESVLLEKRSLGDLVTRATTSDSGASGNTVVLHGIRRVGFRAGIESTNVFMTGYIFFLVFVIFTVMAVIIAKLMCELLVKAGHLKGEKFQDFRNGWTTVLKGVLYRIALIGFPQMVVLCFWEFVQKDSGGEVVLAVFSLFTMLGVLAWAASKVIRLARRSISMHKNPAYILYSDPVSLNKWGFLYVQFKATAYYFVVPILGYILIKGLFIGTVQSSGVVQSIALVIIEAAMLITVCILRPYMDKKTNAFNISICAINFVSAVFLLVFTGVFDQPGIVTAVMGVVFFVYNAAFSTILLIMVLVASVIAITAKNPDTRYQPMRDDRSSFIKSASHLNTELDALGATARGESKHDWATKPGSRLDDDDDSWSSHSIEMQHQQQQQQQTAYGGRGGLYGDGGTRSPMTSSTPAFPTSNNGGRQMPPNYRSGNASPYGRPSSTSSQQNRMRQQASSPWQRGAGYE